MIIKNRRERSVYNKYTALGFKALKKGWPDFLFYKDGKIVFVEVKRRQIAPTEKMGLSKHQREMKEAMELLCRESKIAEYRIEYVD